MKKIIDKRGTGKTSRLFLLAKTDNGVIICKNPNRMREKAYAYGITGLDFISYTDYIWGEEEVENIIQDRPVYIDELSTFMSAWDERIAGYSESEEE